VAILICPKCNKEFDNYSKYGPKKFCSRSCANSRGPRSEEFKKIVSVKATGRKQSTESIIKSITTRGRKVNFINPNNLCKICNKDTGSPKIITCSAVCYSINAKLSSQQNPNCGGQKTTHRSKITNIKNEIFVSESSYEVKLSTILNSLNIYWVRPKFFWYIDKSNNKRRYYPDFYLPDFDVYIDPKNNFLIKTDIDKILLCAEQNNIRIIILGEKFLNDEDIKKVVGVEGNAPSLPPCKSGTLLLS
jgi:hypothetical protein